MRIYVAVLLLLATQARADDLVATYDDLHHTDRALMHALVGGGALSVVHGAELCGFSRYDHALQVAGGVTLAFGLADLAFGIAGEFGTQKEARRMHASQSLPFDLVTLANEKSTIFALNLGLDAGFAFAGLAAVTASQLGVDHKDRWLAGGLASVVQGVFALAIDLTGTLAARRAHRRALERR